MDMPKTYAEGSMRREMHDRQDGENRNEEEKRKNRKRKRGCYMQDVLMKLFIQCILGCVGN